MALHDGFIESVQRSPARPAVSEPGGPTLTYRQLDSLSDRVRDLLQARGVVPGDRVGIYLPKSIDSLAALLGVLKAGAAYVPVDPGSPASRAACILADCTVRMVLAERPFVEPLAAELRALGTGNPVEVLETTGGGRGLEDWVGRGAGVSPGTTVRPDPGAPAYLLYTSGSTGRPKGVVISHTAAQSFVDWCSGTFRPNSEDRFSSHAPFHFDLSIHDLFVSLKHGACVVLLGEALGKDPGALAAAIAAERITIWYSTPSILSLLEEHGRLERHDCRSLRLVLFAGEVFPIPRLRKLLDRWPWPRYCNLYGPTETNVCTWYEVPRPLPLDRTEPLPIGMACAHYRDLVRAGERPAALGEQGELLISGPGLMSGYWNLPDRNAAAFWTDPEGVLWYRTGDLVSRQPDGTLLFHGRRDRMVKRHGYRIELGEIEAGLSRHPDLAAVAVIALADQSDGVVIRAFLVPRDGRRPSIIELKRFSVEVLPRYMVPDRFTFLEAIPQTSTGKTDYQALSATIADG